jgi:branched-subunit amino acid ABC-type transport system permease component
MIRDEAAGKRWGLILMFGGYLLNLAAALSMPSRPWIGTVLWFVAAVGAVLFAVIVVRQAWRAYRGRNPSP